MSGAITLHTAIGRKPSACSMRMPMQLGNQCIVICATHDCFNELVINFKMYANEGSNLFRETGSFLIHRRGTWHDHINEQVKRYASVKMQPWFSKENYVNTFLFTIHQIPRFPFRLRYLGHLEELEQVIFLYDTPVNSPWMRWVRGRDVRKCIQNPEECREYLRNAKRMIDALLV
jgi:hypothetical protein